MKERLDIYLTQLQPELSRERAKALIMAGQVYLNGQKADKAGTPSFSAGSGRNSRRAAAVCQPWRP